VGEVCDTEVATSNLRGMVFHYKHTNINWCDIYDSRSKHLYKLQSQNIPHHGQENYSKLCKMHQILQTFIPNNLTNKHNYNMLHIINRFDFIWYSLSTTSVRWWDFSHTLNCLYGSLTYSFNWFVKNKNTRFTQELNTAVCCCETASPRRRKKS